MDTRMQGIDSAVQEILSYHRNEIICQYCKKKLIEQGIDESNISPYKLGQNIFYPHHQINLKSEFSTLLPRATLDVVMMDDGRLVLCSCFQFRLLICNTDGSEIAAIPVDADGSSLTAVNNSTVAVIVNQPFSNPRIELYDINNKHKIESITLYGFEDTFGMAMKNDNLVVGADRELLIIDYQTGEILQSIGTHCHPWGINVSGNRIFFSEEMENNLYWYSFTDDKIDTLTLPSIPYPMTTLQDGSLYVLCEDGSVQHVSSNGKQFKTLKTNQSQVFNYPGRIRYNSKQKKMVTYSYQFGMKILHEL